ncbi:MAG: gliding motility-associated C-terminal domain-containing protein [Lewinellaceae bacterium]|nr:gliding motility-associated C-terminal domain-containing protein [Lewinellaceae bacterium]
MHSLTYTYTAPAGCTVVTAQTLEIVTKPQVEIQEAGPFCTTSPLQNLVATPPGGVWGGAAGQSGAFDPEAIGLGLFGVTYTYAIAPGCSDTDSITLEVGNFPLAVDLGPDLAIKIGETATLGATVNLLQADLAYAVWQPLDTLINCPLCLTLPVGPFQTTTYSVQVVANNGCTGADQLTIMVDNTKPVYVPNIFSPNDDGVNDLFSLLADPVKVRVVRSFRVFGRWGELIYEAQNFAPSLDPGGLGWDGTYRGKPVGAGVYTWLAEVLFVDGITLFFSGDVAVMR